MKYLDLFGGAVFIKNSSIIIIMVLKERNCFYCGKVFVIDTLTPKRNRRYCTYSHSKMASLKRMKEWRQKHPEKNKYYYERKTKKNPLIWKEKYYKKRREIIELLGGKCFVCGIKDIYHLQIDYIPGSKKLGWRHPRNKTFIMKNKKDFKILCANHHQEKTIKENYKGYEVNA